MQIRPALLPLIVAGLAVPLTAGFLVGGPLLGTALGFAAVATIALIAARLRPVDPIEPAGSSGEGRRVLIVLSREVDEPAVVERIEEVASGGGEDSRVLLLAPAANSMLDRWASDVSRARTEAQRKLVVSTASLGKADVVAEARVGDPNLVQAVEDALRTFPATEVVMVTGEPGDDPLEDEVAGELSRRLTTPFTRIVSA